MNQRLFSGGKIFIYYLTISFVSTLSNHISLVMTIAKNVNMSLHVELNTLHRNVIII